MIDFLLLIIDDIVVVVIYVFSFLGYKIPCMYINRIHYVFFLLNSYFSIEDSIYRKIS